MRRLVLAIACALVTTLGLPGVPFPGPAAAYAQEKVSRRPVGVRWSDSVPRLSFEAHDFVDSKIEKKLKSGLPQRLVMRVYAYAERREKPLGVAALSCRVVYDLWEGGFRVELQNEREERTLALSRLSEVARACLDVHGLALGDRDTYERYQGKRIYFAAIVELNPLSPDTVRRIRRWLSKGGGQLSGDAFFGSFVSIFVSRQMGSAEHTLTFRSPPYVVP